MSRVGQDKSHLTTDTYDPTPMLERIGADMRLFAELVEMFLEEYPPLIAEIRLAILEHNAAKMKYAAHTLRGAIGNFTDKQSYEIASQLELMAEIDDLKDAQDILGSLTEGVEQLANALKGSVARSVP